MSQNVPYLKNFRHINFLAWKDVQWLTAKVTKAGFVSIAPAIYKLFKKKQ